jgi:hypothetical protein
MLFSLTNDTCMSGSRAPMFAVAAACVVLALTPAAPAVVWRRRVDTRSAAGERLHFMLGIAAGGSVLFGLVTILSAIPIFLLDPCRT